MKRNLPPLKALIAFEAAATSKNFSEAAEKLYVTQGAISKQIKLLEEHLQIALFTRKGNSITLSPEGEGYLHTVSQALSIIEKGSEKFYAEQKKEIIIIDIIPSMSSLWMFSRVDKFQRRYPNITMQINSSDNPIETAIQKSDIAIRCIPNDKTYANSEVLLNEKLRLIASPTLLKLKPIKKVSDIHQHTLLKPSNRSTIWAELYDKYGIENSPSENGVSCEHFYMLIQAAIEKLGIALVPDFLCEELIQTGKLVNPLNISIESKYAYYFLTPSYKKDESKVIRFKEWIRSELDAYLQKSLQRLPTKKPSALK